MPFARLSFFILVFLANNAFCQLTDSEKNLPGNWMGIELYQDQESYDGKNYFLPNEEFLVISPEKIRIYFYPYSKSDEFKVKIDQKKITYILDNKKYVLFSASSEKS